MFRLSNFLGGPILPVPVLAHAPGTLQYLTRVLNIYYQASVVPSFIVPETHHLGTYSGNNFTVGSRCRRRRRRRRRLHRNVKGVETYMYFNTYTTLEHRKPATAARVSNRTTDYHLYPRTAVAAVPRSSNDLFTYHLSV